jgi:hypothetical protein
VKLTKIKGTYTDLGEIKLENTKTINWTDLTDEKPAEIPFGSIVELAISFDENDFLSGKDGVIWASYDSRQIDIIKNSLFAQNIITNVKLINFGGRKMFLLQVYNQKDVNEAINFIWKSDTGLRLKPDWSYPQGEPNKSFEQWLSGH